MSGFHFGYMLYMHKKSFKLKAAFNLEEKKNKTEGKNLIWSTCSPKACFYQNLA